MAKYIDSDITVRKLGTWYNDLVGIYGSDEDFVKGYAEAMDNLADVPAADVEEVRHGKWIYEGHHEMMGHAFQCSVCTRWMFTNSPEYVVEEYPYCHCGAKMESVEGLEDEE
uniref:Uncharacterized protein n=1 Tax=Siphoviridae sp. ctv4j104 TaxID=2826510 RepID=A0A8S5M9Q2_9CAUD|nr:MAG TPA: hypothetical protein [Siphoviridae sp. ctv4j104]